ncbi:GCN5 family acetyltransferase [uncultured Bradyrhizobium sp.]|uniref:GCN5 family acetyltransferase n=1 Tax=uncultured Bradyrhizobium sp. TaxID=199684 RepID=UPI0035CC3534
MIRPAVPADKTRVIELLKDSREAAGFDTSKGLTGFVFPFDPAYAERLFLSHLVALRALCLVLDVGGSAQGVLMSVAYEHPFGPVWIAKETVWWIDPEHRGPAAARMLDAYEAWAQGQHCTFVGMAGMGADPDVAKLYVRRGYRMAETHYLKSV